jgi:prepilin signal peptidase PulO-like enzyme (type II secretory pathway)
MIQRIQSLYLSLTILLSLLFLKGSFLKFINKSGTGYFMNFTGTWQDTGTVNPELLWKQVPVSAVIVLIIILAAIALITFRNRKLQMRITLALIISSIILIGLICYYGVTLISRYGANVEWGFRMFIPLLILILGTLAFKGIKKDENLVRSYDRLR